MKRKEGVEAGRPKVDREGYPEAFNGYLPDWTLSKLLKRG